jgi:signal transduction histidine kinase/CheY-like chemotaxis protein/HPt (histidine-containing phosphotransfer) domain-containing protein
VAHLPIRFALATTSIVALLWAGIFGYLVQKRHADLQGAAQESRNLARAFEENIRRNVETIDTIVHALRTARAHDPAHFDLGAWELNSGLTGDLTLQISITDRAGTVIATDLGRPIGQVNVADRDHFRLARDQVGDSLIIGRPVIGRVSGQWSVQFVRQVFDAIGAFDGVVVVSIDPALLSRFYASLDGANRALLLVGQDGFLRAVAPGTVAGLNTDLSRTPLMANASALPFGTVDMAGTPDGIDRIYSWRHVNPYGLVVAVGLSGTDVLSAYRSSFRAGVAIGVGLTIVTVLVGVGFARNRRDLLRSKEVLTAAVDNISQGLVVIDAQRRVPVLNARAAELLGLPPYLTVPGFAFDALLKWQVEAGEFAGLSAVAVRKLVAAGGIEPGTSVYQRTRRNGSVLEIRTKTLDTGLAVRTFTDITEQENTARVLADARDTAEAAVRARSEFLAVMSHEIRTPLNGVIGLAGLLEVMEIGPAQRDYVRLIRQSGDHLLGLVNDILDFSRLEADGVRLEAIDFDPAALARAVIEMFMTQASTKGLHLSMIAADTVPSAVTGDPGRLRQVLLNLVGNAVKFTNEGWVSLTLTREPAADGQARLLFSVADSGIGIVPEAIEQMFQEFTQMDSSISRRFGGSGLGLAICRRLVELMGGTIAVESEPDIGSTFRFDVTLKLADPSVDIPAAEAGPSAGPGLHILLAEDNPTNRLVALRMLERLGHRADAVGTGTEVLAALTLGRYDLILMDVMMPDMDGLTATRQIRATERPEERIAIVGLTAGTSAERLTACLDAGMDAVTTKPVTFASLRAVLAKGRAALPVAEGPGPGSGPGATMSRLRELTGMLGEDAVTEIVHAFIEDTRAHLATMRVAAARDDINTVYRCAHNVTGAARNVGADALAERAAILEQTVGSLSAARLASEIAAMEADLDTALAGVGSRAGVEG